MHLGAATALSGEERRAVQKVEPRELAERETADVMAGKALLGEGPREGARILLSALAIVVTERRPALPCPSRTSR